MVAATANMNQQRRAHCQRWTRCDVAMSAQQLGQRRFGILIAHEVFADQDDADVDLAQSSQIIRRADPRFTDEYGAIVDEVDEAQSVIEIGGHRV